VRYSTKSAIASVVGIDQKYLSSFVTRILPVVACQNAIMAPTIRPKKIGRTVQAMELDQSLGIVVDSTMNQEILKGFTICGLS